jgi:hypothetical protein
LASRSCKNHWEKHLWAFVKVVEGREIYNFPIHHTVHFSWKMWDKLGQTRVNRIYQQQNVSARRGVAHAPRRVTSLGVRAHEPQPEVALSRGHAYRGSPFPQAVRALRRLRVTPATRRAPLVDRPPQRTTAPFAALVRARRL